MNDVALKTDTQTIVVDEVFPHAVETLWKTLTDGALMIRWLRMPSAGLAAQVAYDFTFKTSPAGAWDGLIRCRVLEVIAQERLAFSWTGGDDGNVGYGSRLETVVTWTLSSAPGGTRLRLVHSGFVLPRNESAYANMSQGWKKVVGSIGEIAGEQSAG